MRHCPFQDSKTSIRCWPSIQTKPEVWELSELVIAAIHHHRCNAACTSPQIRAMCGMCFRLGLSDRVQVARSRCTRRSDRHSCALPQVEFPQSESCVLFSGVTSAVTGDGDLIFHFYKPNAVLRVHGIVTRDASVYPVHKGKPAK